MVIVEGIEPYQELQEPLLREVESAPVDDFGPEAGWEFDFARKYPLLYPTVRTAADIIPFASHLFPSGQKEFAEKSLLGKTVDVGLDLAVLIPARYIGMGFKAALGPVVRPVGKGLKAGAKKLPFRIQQVGDQSVAYLDDLANRVDKFVYRTPTERLSAKYGLADDEATALLRGESTVWTPRGRSGFLVEEHRPALAKLFKKQKPGFVAGRPVRQDKVLKNIEKYEVPLESQFLAHQLKEYEKIMKPLLKDKAEIKVVFNKQVERLFGEKNVGKITRENIGFADMETVLNDLLANQGKVLRKTDLARSLHYLMPVRHVLGLFEGQFKTFSKVYKPVVKYIGEMNTSSTLATEQWMKLAWQNKLLRRGKFGRWKEVYTKEELAAAGKALAKADNMQGAGVAQAQINEFIASFGKSEQNIIETFYRWSDFMYGDFMKAKIPQLFRAAGLTERGSAAIRAEMESGGKALSSSITKIFSDSANLAYNHKFNYVDGVLKSLRDVVQKSPGWFIDPKGEGVKNLLKELTFRKPNAKRGFINYLDNYTPRLFGEAKGAQKIKTSKLVPEQMETGFVKSRTNEVAEGRVESLFDMIGARSRSQAKELYMYPHLPEIRAVAETLPPNLQSYVGHYMSRVLGLPSKVDQDVARAVNSVFGTVWDGRRVNNLAWRINDMIYMGGIGFKPFSASRNLLQVPLNVPADLGGIKDVYWLVKAMPRAMKRETFRELSTMGAITEYSPDILFRPVLTKLGPKVLGKQLPTGQGLRDASMFLFKMSDRWNRLWTGSAAMEKWDAKFAQHMIGSKKSLKNFKKNLNLNSRRSYVRKDIEDALELGSATGNQEARKLWIKDVVGETQYLYGGADSPLIGQVGGVVTRTAVVFQSWWMNYASQLAKWTTQSGGVEPAAQRLFVWMLSSAVMMNTMENVWGKNRARSTAFLGPLPSQLDAPASWRPILEGFDTMRMAAEIAVGKSPEAAKKQMIATMKTAMIFMPGGSVLKQVGEGFAKDKWSGAFKASIGYRPPEE